MAVRWARVCSGYVAGLREPVGRGMRDTRPARRAHGRCRLRRGTRVKTNLPSKTGGGFPNRVAGRGVEWGFYSGRGGWCADVGNGRRGVLVYEFHGF